MTGVQTCALPIFKGWVALETVIDEGTVRSIIPRLKEAGAEGINEYSLNKLIY